MLIRITGGTVIDPANGRNEPADVWIADGKIAAVGRGVPRAYAGADVRTLDARGCVVCPGFIDLHMHEDPLTPEGTVDADIFNCMLRMGVTTAVGGNCGSSKAHPVRYLDAVDAHGAPVNVAMLAGHGTFRRAAGARDKYAPATAEQIAELSRLLREALDGGCAGVSFGVRYYPGTTEEELDAAVGAAAGTGKLITSHVRDDAAGIYAAIEEMLVPVRKYGLPVQISHIGSMAGFGQMAEVLENMEKERAGGTDAAMDCYPYAAFSTGLGSTTYDDGWLERYGCDYSVLEYCDGPRKGQRATEESFRELRRTHPGGLTVCYVMREEDVALALSHPLVAIASDGTFNHGQGHPRAAGTFPRFLRGALDGGELSLTEAIRKITALPASRLGAADRKGQLGVGADADVTVFDPLSIRDRATFAEPTLVPEGIRYVIVGGSVAAENGVITDQNAGRAVRVTVPVR